MRDALLECLESLELEARPEWQTVVVVNGDDDDSAASVRQLFPNVQLVINRSNRGVGPARAQGIAEARGDIVILLDADTVVWPGSLRGVVQTLCATPGAAIVGPRLVGPNGERQATARSFPTILTKMGRRSPHWLARRLPAESTPESSIPVSVDYVIGACQVIRRSALDAVGGLDERIFYGPEDVDLCLRIWQAGWSVVWDPRYTVMHHEQRLTKRSRFSLLTLRHVAGLTYYFAKHRYLLTPPKVRES